MAKRNAFLSAVSNQVAASQHIHSQMCKDAAFLAANKVFNMGPGRVEKFSEAFDEALREIAIMTIKDGKHDKELWHTKDTLDRRMKQICGEHFVPWEERYQ